MFFGAAFEDFDPKTGSFRPPWEGFNRIAERARQILKDRQRIEIKYAVLVITWMLNDEEVQEVTQKKESINATGSERTHVSPATALSACIGVIGIRRLQSFRNGSWPEFFAVLSLGLLDEAYRATQGKFSYDKQVLNQGDYDGQDFLPHVRKFIREPWDFALDAIEAVTVAEHLKEADRLVKQMAEEQVSVQASDAAIERHAPLNALKEQFVDYYFSHYRGRSVNEATPRFYDKELTEEEKALLPPDREKAIRILRDAVYKIKKEGRSEKRPTEKE